MRLIDAGPSDEPRDPGDMAADAAAMDRDIALLRHRARASIGEDQLIDPETGAVLCIECGGAVEHARIEALAPIDSDGRRDLAHSAALRCIECQRALESTERRCGW